MNTRERPPKAAVNASPLAIPAAKSTSVRLRSCSTACTARTASSERDRSPEHGEQHDTLVAARALQHVAAELVDQVRRGGEEAAEIVELGGNETNTDVTCRCSSGGPPPDATRA